VLSNSLVVSRLYWYWYGFVGTRQKRRVGDRGQLLCSSPTMIPWRNNA